MLRRPLPQGKQSLRQHQKNQPVFPLQRQREKLALNDDYSTVTANCFPRRSPKKSKQKPCRRTFLKDDFNTYCPLTHLLGNPFLELSYENRCSSYTLVQPEPPLVLNVLHFPEQDEFPDVAPRKPWRQIILEDKEFCYPTSSPSEDVSSEDSCESPDGLQVCNANKFEKIYKDLFDLYPRDMNVFFKQQVDKHEEMVTATSGHFIDEFQKPIKPSAGDDFQDETKIKLNLKNYFLECLPELPAYLLQSLAWCNLSFNNFVDIPEQILLASKNLICLNLRNNPISFLSNDIDKLNNLKFLNLSYCLLSSLHSSVFKLEGLEALDISYNDITVIDPRIGDMKYLRELYLNGNHVRMLPHTILKLRLKTLHCNSTYMCKSFWEESVGCPVQSLSDLSKKILLENDQLFLLDEDAQRTSPCDYCTKRSVGDGIVVLKPVAELFGVRNLPLLFHACSQTCRKMLMLASHLPSLVTAPSSG